MPVTPQTVHDLAVSHRIGLSRYSTMTVQKTLALLNRSTDAVSARLAQAAPEGVDGLRLELLLSELKAIQADGWKLIKARLNDDVVDLSKAEADFAARLVGIDREPNVFSPLPSEAQVLAAVNARPFQGRVLSGWLDDVEDKAGSLIRDTIRQGYVEGRTTSDIVRTLTGTKALRYKDGVTEVTRRRVESVVRTALTHTANVAQESVWASNSDVIEALIWTSTLDARTSEICMARSEKEYPINSGPRPPAHWNCRSVMRPKVADIPGVKPFKPPSYSEWLAGQPASMQDDILGPTKGKLFRSGGLTVDRFVDKAGKTLSLDALRQRDASAFERAGL